MATIKRHNSLEAIHPTELIVDELAARGMKKKGLVELKGMKASNLSRMITRREAITPTMAIKLENALGIAASYWLGLQVAYEKDLLVQQAEEEERKALAERVQVERGIAQGYAR